MKLAGGQGGGGAEEISPLLPRFSAPLLLGLLTGLALLTKLSSLTTLFLVAFIIFWRLFFLSELHENPLPTMLRWLAIIVGITAAMTGWWFVRNYLLYGEWFATDIHLDLAGRADISATHVWELRTEAERAYWAAFGLGQIRPPEWVYRLLSGLTRLGLIGLGLAMLAKLVWGNKSKLLPLNLNEISFEKIIPLLVWAALNLALYGRWVMEVGSVSHTRLVYPAITAISLLLALGWHALLPRRLAGWFSGAVIVSLVALNIYSLGWLIYPAYRVTEPANYQARASATEPGSLDLTFLDSFKLLSSQVYTQDRLLTEEGTRTWATFGDVVIIKALWQMLAPLDKNYSVAAALLAPDGSVLAQRETYPSLGLRPTRYLHPGDTFWDAYPLKLEQEVSEPIVARAVVNLFDFDSVTRAGFPALDAGGNEVTPIVGQIKITPKKWPQYQPSHPSRVNFANAIALIGYDFMPSGDGGEQSTLTLYWESLAPVSEDYVVFIHLLDANGQVTAQADGPPTGNAYPTRWWAAGEIIADTHLLPSTAKTTALRLGLYDLASGQRLPIGESSLPALDNSVEIPLP
jgi:hypothetical protein